MTYSTFTFDRYAWDPDTRSIRLSYSLDDEVRFTEVISFPGSLPLQNRMNLAMLQKALFALHIIGGISYYKTACPPRMDVRSGELTLPERTFWQTVYQNGLGEFFYRNRIDFRGLINFPLSVESKPQASAKIAPVPEAPAAPDRRCLVPIGGGKDSMVTIELLKRHGYTPILFRLGGHPVVDELARLSGCQMITVKRQLAPELFAMNAKGALNGHVPITAFMHCLCLVTAELMGIPAVVFSDERSANIGSVEYLGMEINHQWSKSVQFERMFQAYAKHHIGSSVAVFSLLRPWSELKITQEFCTLAKYVPVAISCNYNWKITDRAKTMLSKPGWCGTCPKCAFVFVMMSAYIDRQTLTNIFGKDLYADHKLIPLFKELLGMENIKPFECVGTPEETAAAMFLALQRGYSAESPVLTMFKNEHLPTVPDIDALVQAALRDAPDHAIPTPYASIHADR